MVRQLAQIAELAALEHVQVRVLQGDHPWLGPYTVRGTSVTIEGPTGRITLPAEPTSRPLEPVRSRPGPITPLTQKEPAHEPAGC